MFFDSQIQVAQFDVARIEDHIELAVLLALGLPTGNGMMMLPVGALHWGIDKETALKRGQEMIDAANELPDPKPESDIVVAKSMAGIDAAVKQVESITGTGKKKRK